jgi:hypothetical protein
MKSFLRLHELKVYFVFLLVSLVLCSTYLFVVLIQPVELGSIVASYAIALFAALAMTQVLWGPILHALEHFGTPMIVIPLALTAATVLVALAFSAIELAVIHSAATAILVGIYLGSVALIGGCILMGMQRGKPRGRVS